MGLLRFLLAISVILAHTSGILKIKLLPGNVAVQIFFIISGFYMSLILNNKYIGSGSYRLFLKNRFLRLYPVYYAVLACTIVVSLCFALVFGNWLKLAPFVNWISAMKPQTIFYLVSTNLFILGQDIVMFFGLDPATGALFPTSNLHLYKPATFTFLLIPQAWSLGIEILFYLIAPFLVRKKCPLLIIITILSLSLRIFINKYLGFSNDPWTYRFFPTELALFLFGVIAYKLYQRISNSIRINQCRFFSMLFFVALFGYQFMPNEEIKKWSFYALALVCIPFIFHLTKNNRMDRRIGELSYPIYIVHIIVIVTSRQILLKTGGNEYLNIISCLLSIFAAFILVKFIADPIEKIRQTNVASYSASGTG